MYSKKWKATIKSQFNKKEGKKERMQMKHRELQSKKLSNGKEEWI